MKNLDYNSTHLFSQRKLCKSFKDLIKELTDKYSGFEDYFKSLDDDFTVLQLYMYVNSWCIENVSGYAEYYEENILTDMTIYKKIKKLYDYILNN